MKYEGDKGSGLFLINEHTPERVTVIRLLETRQPSHRPIQHVEHFASRTDTFRASHPRTLTQQQPSTQSPDPFSLLDFQIIHIGQKKAREKHFNGLGLQRNRKSSRSWIECLRLFMAKMQQTNAHSVASAEHLE